MRTKIGRDSSKVLLRKDLTSARLGGRIMGILKWIGTLAGIAGAILMALNIPESGYGFLAFALSSVAWGWSGWKQRDWPLATLHSVFLGINLVGIYRWMLI